MKDYGNWMMNFYMNRMMNDKNGRGNRGRSEFALQPTPATNAKPSRLSMARKRLAEITLIALEYGAPKKK